MDIPFFIFQSLSYVIYYHYIFRTTLLFLQPACAERRALLIANSTYKKSRLRTLKRDVHFLKKKLSDLGYRVQVKRNIRVGNFSDVVADFVETLEAEDEAYFHYAGHDLEIDGEAFLLGVDFKTREKREARKDGYLVAMLSPKPDKTAFPDTRDIWYWSSTLAGAGKREMVGGRIANTGTWREKYVAGVRCVSER